MLYLIESTPDIHAHTIVRIFTVFMSKSIYRDYIGLHTHVTYSDRRIVIR